MIGDWWSGNSEGCDWALPKRRIDCDGHHISRFGRHHHMDAHVFENAEPEIQRIVALTKYMNHEWFKVASSTANIALSASGTKAADSLFSKAAGGEESAA